MRGIESIYGTFSSSIKFKHIIVLYLIFLGQRNIICILLVNSIIYLILIGDIMYCIYDIVSNSQEPYTTIYWHIFSYFQRKHSKFKSFYHQLSNYKIKIKNHLGNVKKNGWFLNISWDSGLGVWPIAAWLPKKVDWPFLSYACHCVLLHHAIFLIK